MCRKTLVRALIVTDESSKLYEFFSLSALPLLQVNSRPDARRARVDATLLEMVRCFAGDEEQKQEEARELVNGIARIYY